MAISFDTVPKKLSLTGNPILFYLSTTLDFTGKTNVYIKLKISFTFEGATVEFTDQIAIDESLKAATFDVSDILRNHIKTVYRWAEDTSEMIIDRSDNMLLNYSVEAWESYYNTSTEQVEDEASVLPFPNSFYAIGGGLDPEQEAVIRSGGSSFYDLWIADQKKFLTFSPQTQTVRADQPLKLYWFCEETFSGSVEILFPGGVPGVDLTANIFYNFSANKLYEILLTHDLLQAKIASFDNEDYFRVRISGSRSEEKRFTVNRDYYRRNDFFLLNNSLGGIDSIWARGDRISKLEAERNVHSRLTDNNNIHVPRFTQSRGMVKKQITSHVGFIEGDNQAEFYQELLNTQSLMWMNGKYPVPCIVLSENLVLQNDENNGLYSVAFNWMPAYNSKFYSAPAADHYGELDNYFATYNDITEFNGDTFYTS